MTEKNKNNPPCEYIEDFTELGSGDDSGFEELPDADAEVALGPDGPSDGQDEVLDLILADDSDEGKGAEESEVYFDNRGVRPSDEYEDISDLLFMDDSEGEVMPGPETEPSAVERDEGWREEDDNTVGLLPVDDPQDEEKAETILPDEGFAEEAVQPERVVEEVAAASVPSGEIAESGPEEKLPVVMVQEVAADDVGPQDYAASGQEILKELQRAVLPFAEGVTDQKIDHFLDVLNRSLPTAGQGASQQFQFKMLDILAKHISGHRTSAHPDAISLCISIVRDMESVASGSGLAAAEIKNILAGELKRLKEFQQQIAKAEPLQKAPVEEEIARIGELVLAIQQNPSSPAPTEIIAVLKNLESAWQGEKLLLVLAKLIVAYAEYIRRRTSDTIEEALTFIGHACDGLQEIVCTPDITAARKREILFQEIERFNSIKHRMTADAKQLVPAEQEPADKVSLQVSKGIAEKKTVKKMPVVRRSVSAVGREPMLPPEDFVAVVENCLDIFFDKKPAEGAAHGSAHPSPGSGPQTRRRPDDEQAVPPSTPRLKPAERLSAEEQHIASIVMDEPGWEEKTAQVVPAAKEEGAQDEAFNDLPGGEGEGHIPTQKQQGLFAKLMKSFGIK